MLNTDLFSPQVRKRMAFDDYKRNLRGVNDGADFSDSFLVSGVLMNGLESKDLELTFLRRD